MARDGVLATMTKSASKHHSFPAYQPSNMQILTEPSFQTNFFNHHQQHQVQDTTVSERYLFICGLILNTESRPNPLRLVRFVLSPTPEGNMKTRSSSSQAHKVVVLPSAPKEEEWKFGSANTWHSEHLAKLGVSFWRAKHINLESVLEVQESNWSQAMKDST